MKVVYRGGGMFNDIQVVDRQGVRMLLLGDQVQGGLYLTPGADGPGPVAHSEYSYGWLVAGASHPKADMLMVGLGSGAGAVALLTNFPDIQLTVLEIDPQVIAAVEEYFPVVRQLEDGGRLEIVEADASEWLANTPDNWEVGLHDAYTGAAAVEDSMLGGLCDVCQAVYVNCIDSFAGPSMRRCGDTMAAAGHRPTEIFRAQQPLGMPFAGQANWMIVSDQDIDWRAVDSFEPYAELSGPQVNRGRELYQTLISQTVSNRA